MGNDQEYKFGVHGLDAHVQNEPDTAEQIRRNSQGTRVRQNGGANWIHFAVPTPVRLNDNSTRCKGIRMNFSINRNATIRKVHVYNGAGRIAREDEIAWTNQDDSSKSIGINSGAGAVAVCIYVEFDRVTDTTREDVGQVTFHYVRGDFTRIVGRVD